MPTRCQFLAGMLGAALAATSVSLGAAQAMMAYDGVIR